MAPPDDGPSLREVPADLKNHGNITVLHVDDEPDFADLVAIYLEREGDALEVITETSPGDGLERLK